MTWIQFLTSFKNRHAMEDHCSLSYTEVVGLLREIEERNVAAYDLGCKKTFKEVSLRKLQTTLPWTIKYSQDFRSNPQPHKDFAHALVHVSKALGKLQGLVDDMDHDRRIAVHASPAEFGKYVADLVVCALRAANTFPGGKLDLQGAVEERIATKNEPPNLSDTTGKGRIWPTGELSPLAGCYAKKLEKFVALDADGHYLGLFKAENEEAVRQMVTGAATVRLAEPWR